MKACLMILSAGLGYGNLRTLGLLDLVHHFLFRTCSLLGIIRSARRWKDSGMAYRIHLHCLAVEQVGARYFT